MSSQQYADGGSRLRWPDGYDRPDPADREPYPGNISLSHKQAFESIVDEFERWGKTDVEIETAGTHYANDPNIPHKSAGEFPVARPIFTPAGMWATNL